LWLAAKDYCVFGDSWFSAKTIKVVCSFYINFGKALNYLNNN